MCVYGRVSMYGRVSVCVAEYKRIQKHNIQRMYLFINDDTIAFNVVLFFVLFFVKPYTVINFFFSEI